MTTNFTALEEKAREMTNEQLLGAIADIRATLALADKMDRLDGGNRGGTYRDEASVYRSELRARGWTVRDGAWVPPAPPGFPREISDRRFLPG